MFDASHSFDCAIVGGGPTGSLLANKLAEWGHKVALIDRPHRKRIPLAETMRPDAKAILRRNGLMSSIRAHEAYGNPEKGLVWGDGELRWRSTTLDERGYQVFRSEFDQDLRRIAKSQGVRVYENSFVPGPLPTKGQGAFEIRDEAGRTTELFARTIVVAAGRQTLPDLVPLSLRRQLPATSALHLEFDKKLAHRRFRDATVLESVPEGWFSWMAMPNEKITVTLYCDHDELRKDGSGELFRRALQSTGGALGSFAFPSASALEPVIDQQLESVGRGPAATAMLLQTSSDILMVGDAASTVDPLAGEGLEKALGSAEQAAIAVNTILISENHRQAALTRHREWEADLWQEHASRALGFYLKEVRFAEAPFWRRRHEMVKVEVETPGHPTELPQRLRTHPAVVKRPALRRKGNLYVETTGYAMKRSRSTIESIGRVPLEPLMKQLQDGALVSDLMKTSRSDPRLYLLSPRHVVQALTELLRLGMIVESQEHPERG